MDLCEVLLLAYFSRSWSSFHGCTIGFNRLEKRVNKKVMAMFEKAEDEYNGLMSKKNIIEVGCHLCATCDFDRMLQGSGSSHTWKFLHLTE